LELRGGAMEKLVIQEYYRGKRVFVTGHTGFKGTWLCRMLLHWGAEVTGYSLEPATEPSLFHLSRIEKHMHSIIGDIRNFDTLKQAFQESKADIVLHLAAQPIVRESYKSPMYTYETNLMGTVNLMECIRQSDRTMSVLNVTTDKVYQNNEWVWGYRENEPLDGFDPYSNSKSCSELATWCYARSFFGDRGLPISTARAGNVIGGGDFSPDRIIPDCIRAASKGEQIIVRNPYSTRPYQHVLEPLFAYLMIACKQSLDGSFAGSYNVGPDEHDCVTTGQLVDLFCNIWGENICWKNVCEANAPHEANFLKLDCSKIKAALGWKPTWDVETAVRKTIDWSKEYLSGSSIPKVMDRQLNEYINDIT